MLRFTIATVLMSHGSLALGDCRIGDYAKCDGTTEDTIVIQQMLESCASAGRKIVFPSQRTCVTQPLNLSSHTTIVFEQGAVLRAGQNISWNRDTPGRPMVSATNVSNVTIMGQGTFDGHGDQWWDESIPHPMRPQLVGFYNASDVWLQDFTLLNSAKMHLDMYGARFRVRGIKVRSPNVISTDGIDIGVTDAHISDVDVKNGDDCIVIKRTSQNVLVENSIVSQGHGLGVGTSGNPYMRNITFRNILVNDTMDGIFFKFKGHQKGSVSDVRFENITILNARRYALGIDQQIRNLKPTGTQISITNVTFTNVSGNSLSQAGFFLCKAEYPCLGIQFDRVHIEAHVPCEFHNTYGTGSDVYPLDCVPPNGSTDAWAEQQMLV